MAILLIIIVLIYFIGSRENIDSSTDNSKQDTISKLETEEKDMAKERKRFTKFDVDCSDAIHEKTEMALSNLIRIYDYQKEIPTGKKLAEDMKEYTGNNKYAENLVLLELGSCSEFYKRFFLVDCIIKLNN